MIRHMPTNAQVALTAAATLWSGSAKYTNANEVTGRAAQFKAWLDRQDAAEAPEPEQREASLDALVERAEPVQQVGFVRA